MFFKIEITKIIFVVFIIRKHILKLKDEIKRYLKIKITNFSYMLEFVSFLLYYKFGIIRLYILSFKKLEQPVNF